MSVILGIDTSNYTTSVALFDGERMLQKKQLLPVKAGGLGLKQSDAVFHHTQQLPKLCKELFEEWNVRPEYVGVSTKPRNVEGSYMPCFTVGKCLAEGIAAAMNVPTCDWSHQHGHVAAALYSCGRTDLLKQRFLAFHVSGGTTDALLVEPSETDVFAITQVASSLDLKAGQAIDRVGVMLGYGFPAGKAIDAAAQKSEKEFSVRPTIRGCDCSLSGIENQCMKKFRDGESAEDIAKFCLLSVCAALDKMTGNLLEKYGDLPIVFAGGVMSNSIIRPRLEKKYGAFFASPEYSCDNAAGVAYLTYYKNLLK